MCLYYVGKESDRFSQNSGTSWFPPAQAKSLFKSKQEKMAHFKKLLLFFDIKLLYANVQWVYIVQAK